MPFTGTLRSWNEDRGFGFIAPKGRNRRSPRGAVIGLVLAVALAGYGYTQYQGRVQRPHTATSGYSAKGAGAVDPAPGPYRCDGRTHCSQMTSCREATFFLKNCPGVQMDGDHDGVPCEQQWCTGVSAR